LRGANAIRGKEKKRERGAGTQKRQPAMGKRGTRDIPTRERKGRKRLCADGEDDEVG